MQCQLSQKIPHPLVRSAMADGGDDDKEGSLQWLRDHGVTVETPADRIAAKKAAADLVRLKAGDPNTRCFHSHQHTTHLQNECLPACRTRLAFPTRTTH